MGKSPKPMKNNKPVKMVDNAADQFRKTHQDPYESRAKPSRDRIRAVDNHNRACPKLQDELEKRRSISRVTTDEASRPAPKTGVYIKPTSERRNNRGTKNGNKRTKIVKRTQNKRLKKRQKYVKSMIGTCPRCLTVIGGKKMPFRIKRSIESIFVAKEFDKSQSEDDVTSLRVAKNDRKSTEDKISIASSTYPDTSDQTFASYHSFASMDKEPMVD